MTEELFKEELLKININITNEQLDKLNKYYNLLVEWNEKINLTSITEKNEVFLKHFFDSLTIHKAIDLNKISSLADVGTGAGFPGIVIKILFPNIKITLIDSLNKRITFLNQVIKELDLKNIETVHSRIEDYGRKTREKYDVSTARAVAPLNILLEYLTPISKQYVVVMKGDIEKEIMKKDILNKLSIDLVIKETFLLPFESSKRTILVYKKLKNTNIKYPRPYKQIKDRPL